MIKERWKHIADHLRVSWLFREPSLMRVWFVFDEHDETPGGIDLLIAHQALGNVFYPYLVRRCGKTDEEAITFATMVTCRHCCDPASMEQADHANHLTDAEVRQCFRDYTEGMEEASAAHDARYETGERPVELRVTNRQMGKA